MPDNLIQFQNFNQARYLLTRPNADPLEVIRQSGLSQPRAVILISGGADSITPRQYRKLQPLFSGGIAQAALSAKAAIIDGGTDSGVMRLMGQGLVDRRAGLPVNLQEKDLPVLIGMAPYSKVTFPGDSQADKKQGGAAFSAGQLIQLEPNHTHFILVQEEDWGCETSLMYRVGRAMVDGLAPARADETPGQKCKAAVILAGGNPKGVARDEILLAVRNGWPIIVIEGSGGLADRVAGLKRKQSASNIPAGKEWRRILRMLSPIRARPARISDPSLAEIVQDGNLILFPINHPAGELQKLITNELRLLPETLLKLAWERFALYDLNATRQQKAYMPLKNWPLILGIVSTFLVIMHQILFAHDPHTISLTWPFGSANFWAVVLKDLFHVIIITIPILISGILAAETRIKPGSKWIFLRDAAELTKRAIYHLRVFQKLDQENVVQDTRSPELARVLRRIKNRVPTRDTEMVDLMEQINNRLMQSEVKESALLPYSGPIPPVVYGAAGKDDGFSPLSPDEYINIIVNDQINFYRSRTNQKEGQLVFYQVLIWVFGGLGTLLAAFGEPIWLPLTTAFVTAFTAWLDYQKVQETLIKYNHAETRLSNILFWWKSLGTDASLPENIIRLIDQVEDTLEGEVKGWVEHMHETMAEEREAVSQNNGSIAQAVAQESAGGKTSGPSQHPLLHQ